MSSKNSILDILEQESVQLIKWCTPSNFQTFNSKNVLKSDLSISYEKLGIPSTPSGIFEDAYRKAALAYGSDYSLFSVNGSTGSNFVVLRALSKQIPNLRILAQRNVHKSVVVACEDYGINLIFLPPTIDQHLQLFLPNPIKDIMSSIKKTKPQVVLLTNPTYDGFVLDLNTLIPKIRKHFPNIIIFIEEAWGSHLHFSKELPLSAMEAGADICIQSTHKQGGSLQQGGMIHWKRERINTQLVLESFRGLSTTSPSYILLASLDFARELMEEKGNELIGKVLDVAIYFENKLKTIQHIKVIDTAFVQENYLTVFQKDRTKIIVDVSATKVSGFKIAKILEEKYKIIVEKYNQNELLFLVPFEATLKNVDITISALKSIFEDTANIDDTAKTSIEMPKNISKILEVSDVSRLLWDQIESVTLEMAVGRIAAENITPYPPGIPMTIKGEEFTPELIEYYQSQKKYPNSHILAQDPKLNTVLVVK